MKNLKNVEMWYPRKWADAQSGKIGYAILWLLGVPFPILAIIYLFRHH